MVHPSCYSQDRHDERTVCARIERFSSLRRRHRSLVAVVPWLLLVFIACSFLASSVAASSASIRLPVATARTLSATTASRRYDDMISIRGGSEASDESASSVAAPSNSADAGARGGAVPPHRSEPNATTTTTDLRPESSIADTAVPKNTTSADDQFLLETMVDDDAADDQTERRGPDNGKGFLPANEAESSTDDDKEEEEQFHSTINNNNPMSSGVTVLETTTTTLLTTADDEEEESLQTSTSSLSPITTGAQSTRTPKQSPAEIKEEATRLRTLGKEHHDQTDFRQAAAKFGAAADLLLPMLTRHESEHDNGDGGSKTIDSVRDDDLDNEELLEEFATCRLHEALCRLKAQDYDDAIQACTQVLDWKQSLSDTSSADVAPALRARAFHRRAKAYMELGHADRALSDARSAAFLGDRKAVALYGKLMRSNGNGNNGSAASSSLTQLSAFGDLFGAANGVDESQAPASSGSTGSLLQSLLSASSTLSPDTASSQQSGLASPFLPSSLLDFGKAAPGGQQAGGLAKSVLSSLAKRLDDAATQDMICNYLQSTSGPQLQQMAGMAGMSLQSSQANQMARFMNRATPRSIRRTVIFTKRGVYTVQLLRKLGQLVQKYRNLIIILCLLVWTKSAILRPTPVSKKALKKAAKAAAAGVLP